MRQSVAGLAGVALRDVDAHKSAKAKDLVGRDFSQTPDIVTRDFRRVQWDVEAEKVVGDAEAQALVTTAYRAPWKLA